MSLRTSWRSVVRFWDQLFEASEYGLDWLFGRRTGKVRAVEKRRAKKRSHYPMFESLERRELPANSLSFGSSLNYVDESGSASSATITVNLLRTDSDTVTVNYATSAGTATAGSDYTTTTGTLTFGAGVTVQNFTVPILVDSLDEDFETLSITLSSPTNATLGSPATASLEINDDDAAPTVGYSSSSYSIDENLGSSTITMTLSAASGKTVTVDYWTTGNTASAGTDYTEISSGPPVPTLTFNPGETSKTYSVSVTNDSLDEFDETLNLNLGNATNATAGSATTLTIVDDDAPPTVSFGSSSYSPGEAAGAATIAVNLSAASGKTVSVTYATSNGTATSPDYTSASGTLTFAPGETGKTFTVLITSDAIDEYDQTVNLTLSGPSNATLGTSAATLTIVDDDGPPTVQFTAASSSVAESVVTASLSVTLAGNETEKTVTVGYATADGTALAGATKDYATTTGTLTFSPGVRDQSIDVPVNDDSKDEYDEPFSASLSSPVNAGAGSPAVHTVTILDNDLPPKVSFTSSGFSGDENVALGTVTVTLSEASGKTAKVTYDMHEIESVCGCAINSLEPILMKSPVDPVLGSINTAEAPGSNNPANDPEDFIKGTGVLVFNEDETLKTFTMTIQNDTLEEASEDFRLDLHNPVNATLDLDEAIFTIVDDDVTYTENEEEQPTEAEFTGGATREWTYNAQGKITSFKNELGYRWTYTYDVETGTNRLTETNPLGHTITYTYSGSDVTSKTLPDPDGAGPLTASTTTFAYDASNRLTTVIYADSTTELFSYDSAGNVITQTDGLNRRTTYTYDGSLRTSTIDPLGQIATYVYDNNGHVTTAIDPLGRRTTYTVDEAGRVLSSQDPTGALATFTYNGDGQRTTAVDPLGQTTTYAYDGDGRLVSITQPDPDGGGPLPASITTFTHDLASRIKTNVDALGLVTTVVYDLRGRVQRQIDPLGNITTYTYDAASQQIGVTNSLNKTTTFVYDAAGQQTATVDPLANRTTTVFDNRGRVEATIDMLGNRSTSVYDVRDRQIAAIDPYGNRTTTVFDNAGQVTEQIDMLGNRSTSVYDNAGRRTASVDVYGNRSTTVYDAASQVTATIDPYGQRTTYSYDGAGRQESVLDPYGNRSTTLYDAAGRATTQIDMLGNRTTSVYDNLGRQTATIDPYGNRSTTVFDAYGRVEATIDALGNRATTVFDAYGRVSANIDMYGKRVTTLYDAQGRVETSNDVLANRTTTVYDAYGRVSATIDVLGNRLTTLYDTYGRPETRIDVLGNRSTTVYDTYGAVAATVDQLGNRTTSVFDSRGRHEATIDALGKRSTTVYDLTYNRVSASVDQLGNRTTSVFDSRGRHEATINALGARTTTVYDDFGRFSASVDALTNRTTSIYDSRGRQEATVDALGNRTTTVFDGYGRYSATVDALGNRVTTLYDTNGRAETQIDQLGKRGTTVYDSFGRVSATIDQLANRSTTLYDAFGRYEATHNPLGYRTSVAYDSYGRQHVAIDQLGGRTTTAFDAYGRQQNLIDSVANKTTFVYDALGRKTEEIDPLGKKVTFAYDALSRLSSRTDRIGQRREFTYDYVGHQTVEVWYSYPIVVEANRISFTYDAVGNLLTAADADGRYTMTYDALGRASSSKDMWGKTLTFTYDAVGNRTKVEDSAGGTTDSRFNARNQLTYRSYTETATLQMSVTQVYDAAGRQTQFNRYNSASALVAGTNFTYDDAGRLTNLQHKDGSPSNLANYTYVYDAANRLTSETRNGTATTYAYDNSDQVTADGTVTVTYDSNGNRNNGSYTTGTGNRLTTDGIWTYTYNDEGNLTKKSKGASAETWNYSYDQKNQLTYADRSQTDGGAIDRQLDIRYDPFGNRIEKSYDADGAGGGSAAVTRFAYDAWKNTNRHLVGAENWDIWADLDGSSSLSTRYLRSDVIDQLFARIDSGTKYWTLTDRLGSIREVIDNTGAIKNAISYNAFGGITSETDSAFRGRYAWTGREIDVETGMQYNRARYYDAGTGRWISQDPLGFDAGDGNLYRYVTNKYSNHSDPSGLESFASEYSRGNDDKVAGNKAVGNYETARINITLATYNVYKNIGGKRKWCDIIIDVGVSIAPTVKSPLQERQWKDIYDVMSDSKNGRIYYIGTVADAASLPYDYAAISTTSGNLSLQWQLGAGGKVDGSTLSRNVSYRLGANTFQSKNRVAGGRVEIGQAEVTKSKIGDGIPRGQVDWAISWNHNTEAVTLVAFNYSERGLGQANRKGSEILRLIGRTGHSLGGPVMERFPYITEL